MFFLFSLSGVCLIFLSCACSDWKRGFCFFICRQGLVTLYLGVLKCWGLLNCCCFFLFLFFFWGFVFFTVLLNLQHSVYLHTSHHLFTPSIDLTSKYYLMNTVEHSGTLQLYLITFPRASEDFQMPLLDLILLLVQKKLWPLEDSLVRSLWIGVAWAEFYLYIHIYV